MKDKTNTKNEFDKLKKRGKIFIGLFVLTYFLIGIIGIQFVDIPIRLQYSTKTGFMVNMLKLLMVHYYASVGSGIVSSVYALIIFAGDMMKSDSYFIKICAREKFISSAIMVVISIGFLVIPNIVFGF